ncbi:MAG: hypothetical protein ACETV1_01355 [Candidatus Bathyarchaeia archaeon]
MKQGRRADTIARRLTYPRHRNSVSYSELDLEGVRVEGTPWDVASRSNRFAEVWLLGVPPWEKLPRTAVEIKRVLRPDGVVRMIAPFLFFGEPEEPSLEAFIRVAASQLFPELHVVEGEEVQTVLEQHFSRTGVVQFFPEYVEFSAVNRET